MVGVSGIGIPFMAISLAMANIPMSIDEKNKTESLFVSLPVKRSTIVIARYLYTIIVIAMVITVTYFFSRILNILFPPYFEKKIVSFHRLLVPQLVVMYIMSLACPMFFRYGSHLEKGFRVIAISIILIFGSIILIIVAFDMGFDVTHIKLVYTSLGMGVLMLISFGISLLIYKRREF
jgi:ABC-type transport system involved in multi-copper enzyme maturation permease subunit